jgi:hypothetical protein
VSEYEAEERAEANEVRNAANEKDSLRLGNLETEAARLLGYSGPPEGVWPIVMDALRQHVAARASH